MTNFWDGFEKQAKKKKKDKYRARKYLDAAAAIPVATIVAPTVAGLGAMGAMSLEEASSSSDLRKLVEESNKGLKHKIKPTISRPLGAPSWYRNGAHDLMDNTITTTNPSVTIMAHEFGHAKNFQGPLIHKNVFGKEVKGNLPAFAKAMAFRNKLYGPAGVLAPLAASVFSSEENMDKAPLYSLLGAPPILEEAAASARGLKDIYKSLGLKRMAKSVLPLAAALGSYVAAPATAAYLSNRIVKKRKEALGR